MTHFPHSLVMSGPVLRFAWLCYGPESPPLDRLMFEAPSTPPCVSPAVFDRLKGGTRGESLPDVAGRQLAWIWISREEDPRFVSNKAAGFRFVAYDSPEEAIQALSLALEEEKS